MRGCHSSPLQNERKHPSTFKFPLGLKYKFELYANNKNEIITNIDNLNSININYLPLENKEFLTGTFSGADIMTGHACIGAKRVGADISDLNNVGNYIDRLLSRPALQTAIKI